MPELSQRAKQILYAAVTEYVATGEPVGSRTLSKKAGIDLSPASIRNVLADLEDNGYLRQPHASAGRVPTDRAFRLFVDALMEMRELPAEAHARIRARFDEFQPGQNVLRETGKLLSELSGSAAVVVTPRAEILSLKHLRFIRTMPGELLAVLVMSNGAVQNRFLRADVAENELLKIHNLLDDVIEGRTLGDLRDLFARRLATEQVQQDGLRRRAFELGGAVMAEAAGEGVNLVIEGRARLLELPEFQGEGMKDVVSALDEQERLISLLDATMDAKGTTVVVGQEAGTLGGGQLAIVGAHYTEHGRSAGSIGVIGSTRMDYQKVVPLVSATANAMTMFMGRRERESEARIPSTEDDDD